VARDEDEVVELAVEVLAAVGSEVSGDAGRGRATKPGLQRKPQGGGIDSGSKLKTAQTLGLALTPGDRD